MTMTMKTITRFMIKNFFMINTNSGLYLMADSTKSFVRHAIISILSLALILSCGHGSSKNGMMNNLNKDKKKILSFGSGSPKKRYE